MEDHRELSSYNVTAGDVIRLFEKIDNPKQSKEQNKEEKKDEKKDD